MFALNTGASGLATYGEAMTVVGSNIANVNTMGYKSNRVNFQDLLAGRISAQDMAKNVQDDWDKFDQTLQQ